MEQNKAEVITPADSETSSETSSEASTEEQVQPSSTDSEMQSSGESQPAAETQPSSPVGEDFGQMFEESMRSVQPGGIVSGYQVPSNRSPSAIRLFRRQFRVPLNSYA